MTLYCLWSVYDATNRDEVSLSATIEPGRHAVERIPNPIGLNGDWIVLKGTLIGGAAYSWEGRSAMSYGDERVIIEEEPRLDGPAALVVMSHDVEPHKMPWEE